MVGQQRPRRLGEAAAVSRTNDNAGSLSAWSAVRLHCAPTLATTICNPTVPGRDRVSFHGLLATVDMTTTLAPPTPMPAPMPTPMPTPTVLCPLGLPALLHHVLSTSLPTALIVCSSRDAFLHTLVRALALHHGRGQEKERLLALTTPTLHNLRAARHVNVSFCASVQALLAHLTARNAAASREPGVGYEALGAGARIVLVNPLSLHAATPSFSAQGLSRTLATAVETALRLRAALIVAECQAPWAQQPEEHVEDAEDPTEHPAEEAAGAQDPWEQELSVLNVSAKRFGSGRADRPWAGRTVKAKRVAARWFRFCRLDDLD